MSGCQTLMIFNLRKVMKFHCSEELSWDRVIVLFFFVGILPVEITEITHRMEDVESLAQVLIIPWVWKAMTG